MGWLILKIHYDSGMKTILVLFVLFSNFAFASVFTSSVSQENVTVTPFMQKKFDAALNLGLGGTQGVLGVRTTGYFSERWGIALGLDNSSKITDYIAAAVYRWPAPITAFETFGVRVGAAYSSAREFENVKTGKFQKDLERPLRLIVEFDIAISLSPRSQSQYLSLGFASKSIHEEMRIDEDGQGLLRLGAGWVF